MTNASLPKLQPIEEVTLELASALSGRTGRSWPLGSTESARQHAKKKPPRHCGIQAGEKGGQEKGCQSGESRGRGVIAAACLFRPWRKKHGTDQGSRSADYRPCRRLPVHLHAGHGLFQRFDPFFADLSKGQVELLELFQARRAW